MKKFEIKREYCSCRVCDAGKNSLSNFFHIDSLPMPEGHVVSDESEYVYDMDIYWCKECGMVQTQLDLNLDDYYKEYVYTTGSSKYVEEYMQNFAQELCKEYFLTKDSLVVEVGSGDGAQLEKFRKLGCKVIGIEPSIILASEAEKKHIPTIVSMFNADTVCKLTQDYGNVDAIIIQYTFDHLQQPAEFIRDVSNLLSKNGVLAIEVHDFEKIYERNEACLFTHEHSIYPTFNSIGSLMQLHGMKIIGTDVVSESKRRGNSIVIVAAKLANKNKKIEESLTPISQQLKQESAYNEFGENIYYAHKKLRDYVTRQKEKGNKIAGYGAAGRGVDTCVISGLNDKLITCVYDMNTAFHGKKMPVSNIEVRDPGELFNDNPDELIVFSYGYIDEIKQLYKNHPVCIISLLDLIK
jgi:SAM-dependent methyltransferase